jgi:hypothetical protein
LPGGQMSAVALEEKAIAVTDPTQAVDTQAHQAAVIRCTVSSTYAHAHTHTRTHTHTHTHTPRERLPASRVHCRPAQG